MKSGQWLILMSCKYQYFLMCTILRLCFVCSFFWFVLICLYFSSNRWRHFGTVFIECFMILVLVLAPSIWLTVYIFPWLPTGWNQWYPTRSNGTQLASSHRSNYGARWSPSSWSSSDFAMPYPEGDQLKLVVSINYLLYLAIFFLHTTCCWSTKL